MSGIKRQIEDKDPDYEDISVVRDNKRLKVVEQNAREATVQKIEAIIKDQFSLEMKNKEHEIEVIGQRLNEARRMMDKLRACIVANYYASAGQPKVLEASRSDTSVLNHPAIRRFLESPSRSSSPFNQGSDVPSLVPSETESLSQLTEGPEREEAPKLDRVVSRTVGKVKQRFVYHASGEDSYRLYVKKTIVVGNVSKYIPPDKREENDQSTHKWMVYVRGSRKEPSIDHFVKKVWFFLHPSYKPNDLVEVSEPPFHLTRRGWGEFPVRVQIHFKDPRNKRIDIIHHLKLDRTYTGLQTLGAETVVDVELHRSSLGEDHVFLSSSSCSSPIQQTTPAHPPGASADGRQNREAVPDILCVPLLISLGLPVRGEAGRLTAYNVHPSERTPTRPKLVEKITLGSHGNSAFQPITASCKIIPQGQVPNPAESPGKSFQPITMSCKIVSGSPISTPSHSPLPRTPTSTPVHMKQGSSVISNPYIIVDKPGQVIGMPSPALPTGKQMPPAQVPQSPRSPAPSVHASGFLSSGVKVSPVFHDATCTGLSVTYLPLKFCFVLQVIIKQEPGEVSTSQPQQILVSTAASQQSAPQQFVSVKGGHMIAISPQKQSTSTPVAGATQSKVVGIPVGSALQSAVKQVAISSGQILVAKSAPAVSKMMMGQKQVIAQGVAKAIVSGAGGTIVGQQVQTTTKAASSSGGAKVGGQGSVMATLQLPANNLASLANLPPGTKLYLTTNSKNPSGKGKLLLIPQGAILRASNPSGCSTSSSSTTSLPSSLSYTSYILKQTPQGTFLVGQPVPPGSGKPGTSSLGSTVSSTTTGSQQAIRVTASQKAAILAQVVGGSQASQVKLTDSMVKTVTAAAAAQLSKPGTTTVRMTGGMITATSSTTSLPSDAIVTSSQQVSGTGLTAVVTVAKSVNVPVISLAKGAGSTLVGGTKSASPSLMAAASLVATGSSAVSGKTATTLSGMLKIHSGNTTAQQTVLTIPANQLKQLGVSSNTGGLQTILMPVSKGEKSLSKGRTCKVLVFCWYELCSSEYDLLRAWAVGLFLSVFSTEHIENLQQLLTAAVKKFPLIFPEKTEDSHPFCASSLEQYYSWNIGKRRAAEVRAVKRLVQYVLDTVPSLQTLMSPKTREVVQWCRHRGYTPPDPEPQGNEENSIEDILTQIDNEPEYPSTLQDAEELCQRLEELQALLKTEPEAEDELLDVVGVQETPSRATIKREDQKPNEELHFFLGPSPAAQFVRDTAQQIGVSLQHVELEKNVYSPVVEEMILKAMEQFASDILREALARAYLKSSQNRAPKEITAMDIHQAVAGIPACDFLTNRFMGFLVKDRTRTD
uniref:YEATS domain-containing protein 2 n=1 Tax=Scleropages formosus TaxID=113540 RepID=A0A8C9R7M8_SCLFO